MSDEVKSFSEILRHRSKNYRAGVICCLVFGAILALWIWWLFLPAALGGYLCYIKSRLLSKGAESVAQAQPIEVQALLMYKVQQVFGFLFWLEFLSDGAGEPPIRTLVIGTHLSSLRREILRHFTDGTGDRWSLMIGDELKCKPKQCQLYLDPTTGAPLVVATPAGPIWVGVLN